MATAEGDDTDREQAPIEAVRQILLELVSEGEQSRPDGVHLTHIGGLFAKKVGVPFGTYIGHLALSRNLVVPLPARKMATFVDAYCSDLFDVDRPADGVLRLTLRRDNAPGGTSTPSIPPEPFSDQPPVKYRKGVWLAFVRPLQDGLRRYLLTDQANIAFRDIPEADTPPSSAGRYEIGREFIVGIPLDQPVDGPRVHHAIQGWLVSSGAPVARLLAPDEPSPEYGATINDLLRIISSLPPDVASRWLIPAEILRRLRH